MPARSRREPLSRDRLLAAAVELADAEGLGAVTMRRLSATVGVEAMSLYHHLSGKEALLEGLVDTVVAEIDQAVHAVEESEGPLDWQRTLRRRFLAARTVMLRHPWAPALIGSRTSVPPSIFGIYEALLATMIEGGFSYHLAHRALHTFASMPLGFVQELFSPAATGTSVDTEVAEAELIAMAEMLPHITAMVASEIHTNDGDMLGWCDSQPEFEFTLDLILDGFARQLG
ncbi:MAG: regulatory protein TetR [Nocardioides sp.]|uniref:TetR/AcrR family transcriptional regulator n=1 Tax=Nocardioides sp. TaxID=35761 RepID=UPI0026051E50|nr:TetR/AcrR family transcriptional regulator C-terminal domain-containing protein [Nocardioides sp.]MCW2832208.1 regulatory protein TetR [Nocardioides sp.]